MPLFPQDGSYVFCLCNKSYVPGVFCVFPVIAQDEEFAGRHTERPEMVAVPILFILLVNCLVPHAGGQDISDTGQLAALYIPLFQGCVDGVGIGGDGIGQFPVEDDSKNVFLVDLIEMRQGQFSIGILAVDIQNTCFDFDGVAGEAAKPVGPDGWTVRGCYGAVAAIFILSGFYQVGGKKEPAGP